MPKRNAEKKRAREIQQAEGIGYHDALNRARAEAATETATEAPASAPAAVAYVLQPTAAEAELGITAEELGVRALPADATPEQRAHAEAVWRPNDAGAPCRCSRTRCHHGAACDAYEDCEGRLAHVDRHPGSMFALTAWYDVYRCDDCEETFETTVTLPELPWGEVRDRDQAEGERYTGSAGEQRVTVVYSGIRHPNFPERDPNAPRMPDGDGTCRPCGGYAFEGLVCEGCRREGWTDYYGDVQPPEESADEYDEDQDHEPEEEDQEEHGDYLDDGPEDDVDPIGEPPEDYYDGQVDEGELGPPSSVPPHDGDPQPTAADWSPLDEGPRAW